MKKLICIFKCFVCVIIISNIKPSYSQNINHPDNQKISVSTGNYFIKNQGQWDKEVLYLARLGGLNAWITDSAVVYDFNNIELGQVNTSIIESELRHMDQLDHSVIYGQVIRMSWDDLNNNNNPKNIEGFDLQSTYYNYFLGNDQSKWASFVPLYKEIKIQNIFQDIDARFYFQNNLLRYDLIVNPNADINLIKFNFKGQDNLYINDQGELILKTSLGDITHYKLFASQNINGQIRKVECSFALENNNIYFNTGDYDHTLPLIIDPLIFSTFLGGNGNDEAYDVDLDASGNIYIGGTTANSTFPVTSGAYKTSYAGGTSDAYITKMNSSGTNIIFSTFIGGSDLDYGLSISIDANKNTYITGRTFSTNFPVTSGAFQTSFQGGTDDGYCTKLNSTGSALVYSTYLGSSGSDLGFAITVDASYNAYIAGWTNSTGFPVTSGAFQTSNGGGGNYDGFVTKLNSAGTATIYSTFLGGSNQDYIQRIKLDNNNNIYIAGYTYSSNFPVTSGAFQNTYGGGTSDGFITKLNSTGQSLIFSSFIGKAGNENCRSVFIDNLYNVYISGYTTSSNFYTTTGAYQTTLNSSTQDGYITKINPTGTSILLSTYFGGNGIDEARSVRVDSFGNISISGYTSSTDLPVTNCAYQSTYGGGTYDAFFAQFNPSLSLLYYSTYIGGSNNDEAIEQNNIINNSFVVVGRTTSTNFPVTSAAYQTTYGGGVQDAFVLKIAPDISTITTGTISTTLLCSGISISVPFTVSGCNVFSGNIFTAQLSSATGSFTSPINIGTQSGTTSGSITATIPRTVPYGTNYKIRVISSYLPATGSVSTSTLTIYPAPIANYSVNDTSQCLKPNNLFEFTNNSTITKDTITGFYWLFGDGSNSYNNNPQYSYSYHDTFLVTLIATSNHGCNDTFSKSVFVRPMPIARFTINDSDQCLRGNHFIFTNKSGITSGMLTYFWEFGDGNTSDSTNPTHQYSTLDTFIVKLIAISDFNCKDSTTKEAYIEVAPHSDFAIADSAQCLVNNFFNFTNNSSIVTGTITGYNWLFGDGTSSPNINSNHSYTTHDTFMVKLVSTSNNGCTDTITKKAYVYPMPKADYTIWDSFQCFTSNKFGFVNTSRISWGKMTYLWNFGDGDTSTLKNPAHHYITPGTFLVSLITTSGFGCIDSTKKHTYVVVHPKPDAEFYIIDTAQCLTGNVFSYIDTSSISGGTFTQTWYYGDGDTSTAFTPPNHTYKTADTFYTKLLLISDWLCKDSILKPAIVYPMPKTGFTVNDTIQCIVGNNFIFVDTTYISSGSINKYQWNLGDGTTAFSKVTNHNYSVTDTFIIQLKTTSTFGCSDSISKKVYVLPTPVADFAINDTGQCLSGNLFVYTDRTSLGSGIHTNHWLFGDGNTSDSLSPKHSYLTDSTYTVKLITISVSGCFDSIKKTVTVYSMPETSFTISDSAQCLSGNNFIFRDNTTIKSGSIKSLLWSFGDGKTGNTIDTNHSYLKYDTFTVSLKTASAYGCNDSISKIIYVIPMPKASFAINDSTQCLNGNVFYFYDSTITAPFAHTNHWEFGDSNTSDSLSPKYTYTKSGKFKVKLFSSSALGCTDSIFKNVNLLPSPIGDFVMNKDTQIVCGNKYTFTNNFTVIPPDTLTYTWYFGDGDSSALNNPSHKYMKTGKFPVILVAKNLGGCTDTILKEAVLLPCTLVINFSFLSGCVGDSIIFINNTTISGDSIQNFLWNFGDSSFTIIRSNPKHVYTKPGTYIVGLTALTYSGYKDTTYKNIIIYPKSTISLSFSGDTTFYKGNSVTVHVNGLYDSILWSNGKQVSSVNFNQSGNYKVLVIDSNGCRDSRIIHILVETIPELNIMNVITPNGDGYNDYWKILNTDAYGKLKVRIFNRWGDELYSSSDYKNDWDGKYKGKDLPEGTYYYLIETEKGEVFKGPINILR